jgi:hypothetical protein
MRDIADWLASIGASEYAERFIDNAIDLSVLGDLTEQDPDRFNADLLAFLAEIRAQAPDA